MKSIPRSAFAVAVVLCGCVAYGRAVLAQGTSPDSLRIAIDTYMQNHIPESAPLFEAAVRQFPGNARAHAWLAESSWRLGRIDVALREARHALTLDRCNAFAHLVIANSYNSQYGSDRDESGDSTWNHLRAAVACDSTDGNALMPLWNQSMLHGDTTLEHRALAAMVKHRFLMPVWMTWARWSLDLLPPNAIALTGGDMDTYPVVAAQSVFGVRRDVVVVNVPMLDLPWYVERVRRLFGLPLPSASEADTSKAISHSIVAFWRRAAAAGTLGRPLAMLMTVGGDAAKDGAGVALFSGPFWIIGPGTGESFDQQRLNVAYRAAEVLDWNGEAFSTADRSPVRRTTMHPAMLVGILSLTDGWYAIDRKDLARARQRLEWSEAFLDRAHQSTEMSKSMFAEYRKSLATP